MRQEKIDELKKKIRLVTPVEIPKPVDWPEELDKPFISSESHFFGIGKKVIKRDKLLKGGKAGDAVNIIAITEDNNISLIVQPRCYTDNLIGVEIPAGYIDDSETPEEAAKRELSEETGMEAKTLNHLTWSYQDIGAGGTKVHTFIATGCKKVTEKHLDPDEIIQNFECTFDEALELINLGYIKDLSSKLALTLAKEYLKKVED